MKDSVRVIARITAKPGTEDRVKSVLSNLVEPTRHESGCLNYELLQNSENAAEFVLLEEWENTAALDNHTNAPHTKQAESEVEDWLEQVPPDVRIYRTIV